MINFFRRQWDQRRINRFIKLRNEGFSVEKSLSKAFLTAAQGYDLLNRALDASMGKVGIFSFGPRGFGDKGLTLTRTNDGGYYAEIKVILVALISLRPLLSVEQSKQLTEMLDGLTMHNWGGVRRAADAAKKFDTTLVSHD